MTEPTTLGSLHQVILYLPAVTTVLSALFCYQLFSRYRSKGGGLHLLWWGIGMATYGIGTFTEAYTSIFGWSPAVFRTWYIAGAFLGGYPLAQGSIYLLMNRKFAHRSAIVATTVIVVASLFVIMTPLDTASAEVHRLSGEVIEWSGVRLVSPFINIYSLLFLAGGAVVSAMRFRKAGNLRHRYVGNILIAIGAILPGIGGSMTRAGYVEVLYITELLGLCLIYAGYRMNIRRPAAVAQRRGVLEAAAVSAAIVLLAPTLVMASDVEETPTPEETASEAAETADGAEAPADEATGVFFGTTTVTATGSRTESFSVPVPVIVIEDIEEQEPDNAADLLRAQPGVDVNGIGPNQARPIIRGQRGLRVLFLENGLRMNNARRQSDFGEIPGLVDIESVESVEVVRGPASVLYGTDAIGGVINLVTTTPTWGESVHGGVRLRGSSAGEQLKGTASVAGAGESIAYQIGATWRDAGDYDAPAGSYGDITLDDTTTVVDTGVQDQSLWGRFDYRLNDRSDLFLRFNRYRAEDAGFGFVEPEELGEGDDFRIRITYPFQDFDKLAFGYEGYGLETGIADGFEGRLYYQKNKRQLANDIFINIGPIFPGAPDSSVQADTENFTDLETLGTRLQATKSLGDRNLLTYGAELFQDDSFNTDLSTTTTTLRFPFPPFEVPIVDTDDIANAPNATNTSYGVFAQDELLFDKLAVTLGARYQTVDTRAEDTPGWDTDGLDFDDSSLVGAVNALYQVSPTFNLAGSVGTAFRAPSIIERLFNGPTPEGAGYQILNPNLKSEDSFNYDIGFKYLDRHAYLNVTYFKNEIDNGIIQYFLTDDEIAELPEDVLDEIRMLGPNTFVVQQRNIEELQYEGVELDGGYRFDNGLSFGGNYTWIDSKRLDSTNPPTGANYGDKLNLFARFEPANGRYWAEYRFRYSGEEDANIDPNEPVPPVGEVLPSFTVHRLSGGVAFGGGSIQHRIGLTVDNLTDELYAEFSNATFFRPQPERTFILSYDFRF